MRTNHVLDLTPKIIVDLFAGGGGVSEGIEMALGYPPHVAVNHNDDALSMHRMNHPFTRHLVADVFEVDPRAIMLAQGRPVGALHLSPDCTHHSQARGGQPRDRKIRSLTWVAARWAGQVRPDVITLENVKQILHWGPLIAKRDPATGRVIKIDGKTIAEPGERVPLSEQFLVPDQRRVGQSWRHFVQTLQNMGYTVETRRLVAADYGAATSRERLFMIARCDGLPIVWPEATHSKKPGAGQKRWRPAADVIDWSIPCPSIFGRKKDLAEATMRRIARGIERYVIKASEPFIVPTAHFDQKESLTAPSIAKFRGQSTGQSVTDPVPTITSGGGAKRPAGAAHALGVVAPVMVQAAHGEGRPGGVKRWGLGAKDPQDPLSTITANGGGQALAAATLVQTGYGERNGQLPRALDIDFPLGTIVASGKHALSSAYLMQCNGGFCTTPGHEVDKPMSTITNSGSQQQIVSASLADCGGMSQSGLSEDEEAGALRVAAFLIKYYGEGGQWGDLNQPIDTITTKDRLALVTVYVRGTPYVIVDIGLRMLTPRELYRAQGFGDNYIIDFGHDGRKFPKSKQVKMVGNSVPPNVIEAIYRANVSELSIRIAA